MSFVYGTAFMVVAILLLGVAKYAVTAGRVVAISASRTAVPSSATV